MIFPYKNTHNTGWWYTYPSGKYEFVNWDDDIPNIWKNHPHVPVTTNQNYIAPSNGPSECHSIWCFLLFAI